MLRTSSKGRLPSANTFVWALLLVCVIACAFVILAVMNKHPHELAEKRFERLTRSPLLYTEVASTVSSPMIQPNPPTNSNSNSNIGQTTAKPLSESKLMSIPGFHLPGALRKPEAVLSTGKPTDIDKLVATMESKLKAQNPKDTVVPPADYTQHEIRHSRFDHAIDYTPWAPFANTHKSKPFDKVNCPPFPENGYPKTYNLKQLLDNWNTDSTEIPTFHYDSLCHFDYMNSTQLQYAYNYRESDLPFVIYNHPQVDEVVRKWSDLDYMHGKLGSKKYHTETSESNHFMYWRGGRNQRLRNGQKWKAPTGSISVKFEDWLRTATKGQNMTLDERGHQYFRVSSDPDNT